MKFDFIIGNPPYQDISADTGNQAKPLYNIFIEQVKKLNPNVISMIIPSRWFSGGMGLESFRQNMMSENKIKYICDYINAKQCFPNSSISGGVCIFLWDNKYVGACEFTSINGDIKTTLKRSLNEFPILVRYNDGVSIIHKINSISTSSIMDMVSSISPFGLSTKERGESEKVKADDVLMYSSVGTGYIRRDDISKGEDYLDYYKVMISKASAEHAGEGDKDGRYRVLTTSMRVINPNSVCTHSYIVIGKFAKYNNAANLLLYLKTKFVRSLMLLTMSSINISKISFLFVPLQDFTENSDIDWIKSIPEIDQQLYTKYGLDTKEIEFIETHVKEMA